MLHFNQNSIYAKNLIYFISLLSIGQCTSNLIHLNIMCTTHSKLKDYLNSKRVRKEINTRNKDKEIDTRNKDQEIDTRKKSQFKWPSD